jgi:hypothetical protein
MQAPAYYLAAIKWTHPIGTRNDPIWKTDCLDLESVLEKSVDLFISALPIPDQVWAWNGENG